MPTDPRVTELLLPAATGTATTAGAVGEIQQPPLGGPGGVPGSGAHVYCVTVLALPTPADAPPVGAGAKRKRHVYLECEKTKELPYVPYVRHAAYDRNGRRRILPDVPPV